MSSPTQQNRGFTVLEVVIVVAIIGVLSAGGAMFLSDWTTAQRTKGAVRELADMAYLARGEAIRTGTPHLLFFDADNESNDLETPSGTRAAALIARDDDGDGLYDAPDEFVSAALADTTDTLFWGVTRATTPAPEDPSPSGSPPPSSWTFVPPSGTGTVRWTAFLPDGTPRAFTTSPLDASGIGSGNGAVYVTNGDRDYAMVLTALGGVRVHSWEIGASPPAWTQ